MILLIQLRLVKFVFLLLPEIDCSNKTPLKFVTVLLGVMSVELSRQLQRHPCQLVTVPVVHAEAWLTPRVVLIAATVPV